MRKGIDNLDCDFEAVIFEAECITNLLQIIGDYAQEGSNSMECYKDCLWYVGTLSAKNTAQLKKLYNDFHSKQLQRAE